MTKDDTPKVKVDIFVPLDSCACNWEGFMDSIFRVIAEYRDIIDFETKNLNSQEAHSLNLNSNCVVIDKEHIIRSPYIFKKKMPKILKEKH
jgi:hypothetical protein